MNGYTLANHFRRLRSSFTFSATEADLFYELVALCNERSWPTEFQYPNQLLCATLSNMAESTLVRARNRLKQAGLLDFTSGHKRNPTVYRLLDPDAEIPLHSAGTSEGRSRGISEGRSEGCIIKEKTKRKTNPAPATAGSASAEDSSTGSPPALPAWQTWLTVNAPEVLRLKTPLTAEQWAGLVADFGEPLVHEVLLAMQNHAGLARKYTSANLTAREWCKRRQPTAPPAPPPRPTAPPADTGPALNHAFLAEQQAREAEEQQRLQVEWQQAHALAA